MDALDFAHAELTTLLEEFSDLEPTLKTEADVRLKVVDGVLQRVLGWHKSDIAAEESTGEGFLDYKLSVEGAGRVVVEAKKISRDFGLAEREPGAVFKLSGPAFKNSDVFEGIQQAIRYSAYKNTELAVVTNGMEWVIFRSNRLGDGTDTLEGKAFVFPSLDAARDNFKLFFDLLHKTRVTSLVYRALFQEAEGKIIRHGGFKRSLRTPSSAMFLNQSEIIPELDRIMTSFFQRLSDERDREMLNYCFVETKESKAAEQRLLRLAEDLVGHIKALDTASGAQLSDLLDRASSASLNQFILLVGTKGAGKSTFIQRFFGNQLSKELQESLVVISVNLSDSEGDESKILEWLRQQVLQKAESALADEIPTWDELIGHMFFSEYQRWSKGSMAPLYQSDKEAFKIAFGEHIESIRSNQPMDYLRGLLRNFSKSRKKLPCLIFDNADHFSIEFQEKVFQFARSLFEQELCVVLLPITDKTSWQLSRQGALQSFENEALLLPTPSAKQVLEKRIDFVLKKMDDEAHRDKGSYFVGKGIRVNIPQLTKFVRGLQEVFLNSARPVHVIGKLANHSIREVLELVRDVVNSPHVGMDELFKAYVLGSAIHVQDYRTWKALIRGRYDIYVGNSKFVHNIFELNTELETTPLLGLRILQALKDAEVQTGDTKGKSLGKADLVSYLSATGIERRAIMLWLDALLKKALVLNYDPTKTDAESATRLEISPSGEQHLFWAKGSYDYLGAMAEVTTLLDPNAYDALESASRGEGMRRTRDMIGVFAEYLRREDFSFCRPPDHESYAGQHELRFHLD